MSGAWRGGTNAAVNSAPPNGRFQSSEGGGNSRWSGGGSSNRNSGSGGNRRNNQGGYGGGNRRGGNNNSHSNNNNNRRNNQFGGGGGGDNNNNNHRGGRGGGRGGGGGRGRGRGRGNRNNPKPIRIVHKDVQLLNSAGLGKTKEQQSVKRYTAQDFMRLRLAYLEPVESIPFTPHEQCHWTDEDRVETIRNLSMKAMELGDVSKYNTESTTAPALEDCVPLAINEETRWKSKVMDKKTSLPSDAEEAPPETTEEIVAKSRLILNKVSWTTLDRMTEQFMETAQIETNAEVRKEVINLIIQKSHMEHHFGPLYAHLCGTIAKRFKPFKKELLTQCQEEFETDTSEKIAKATEGMTDKDEIEYHTMLIRKGYLGHMKFLGNLYKQDVVKLSIMMHCLDELLKDEEDEDSIECFSELMTTMGEKLDGHAKANKKSFDWGHVVALKESTKISNRIKFLLRDLLELRDNGWVSRRKKETAVALGDLHKEIAQEERAAASASKQNKRRSGAQSSSNLRRSQSVSSVPATDNDGFVPINRSSIRKVSSKVEIMAPEKAGGAPPPSMPSKSEMRRSQSQPADMKKFAPGSPAKSKNTPVLSPDECGEKAKNMFKEYFVGGDTGDAILTLSEVVQVGTAGDVDRGAKFVESSVFLVMEMKKEDAAKCAMILCRAFTEGKIPAESFPKGLSDPLEFLNDVEIDAPLAGNHLSLIVAEAIKVKALELESLLKNAPQDFKEFGKPAVFCAKVLKALGKNSDADMEMVNGLMTDFEKTKYETAKKLYETI